MTGATGPAGAGNALVSSREGSSEFTAYVSTAGTTQVRDPWTTPTWHGVSALAGYPTGVNEVSLTEDPTNLFITVANPAGTIARAACVVYPAPGVLPNPPWPGNCGAPARVAAKPSSPRPRRGGTRQDLRSPPSRPNGRPTGRPTGQQIRGISYRKR